MCDMLVPAFVDAGQQNKKARLGVPCNGSPPSLDAALPCAAGARHTPQDPITAPALSHTLPHAFRR
jgi:hypothetical protein